MMRKQLYTSNYAEVERDVIRLISQTRGSQPMKSHHVFTPCVTGIALYRVQSFPSSVHSSPVYMMAVMDCAMHLFLSSFTLFLLCISCIQAKGMQHVTCGSVLKLMNMDYNVRLHSHDVKYGSGSGQQSVTGTDMKEDGNSYWLIKAESRKQCTRGQPIRCGDTVRLEHVATKKNLHSHLVSSPLSGKQEVSAYGDHKGEGDTGDNWMVLCNSDFWERDDAIKLKHVDTETYLAVSGRTYGSPISGQIEVVGDYSPNSPHTQWITMEGLFIHPNDFKAQHHHHTEL